MCDCRRKIEKIQLIVKNTPDGLNDQLVQAASLGYQLVGNVVKADGQWAQMVVRYALEDERS